MKFTTIENKAPRTDKQIADMSKAYYYADVSLSCFVEDSLRLAQGAAIKAAHSGLPSELMEAVRALENASQRLRAFVASFDTHLRESYEPREVLAVVAREIEDEVSYYQNIIGEALVILAEVAKSIAEEA
jgi:hypothetical protein